MKNADSKSLEKLRKINAKHKVILTGTPLQNNTKELWTLLNILDSSMFFYYSIFLIPTEKFASADEFLKKFGELKESEQVTELRKVLAPYFLRRMKEDVDKTIPGTWRM